jgi:hypothetical protein
MTTATAPTTGPREYVVALTSPPEIKCPPWCVVPYQEHVDDLTAWEGLVIHWSDDRGPVLGAAGFAGAGGGGAAGAEDEAALGLSSGRR